MKPMLCALVAALALPALADPPRSGQVAPPGTVDCSSPNLTPGARMICAVAEEDRLQREREAERASPAGAYCAMGSAALQRTIREQHEAWCVAYDLSPETCWCLTNQKSLWRQEADYRKACESRVPESADRALDAALERCNALPSE